MDDIDASEIIENFNIGFKYKGKPVDMIDNEYVNINANYLVNLKS